MKLVLKNVRLSYANLFEPKAGQDGQEPKYSANFIIPKTDAAGIANVRKVMQDAAKEYYAAKGGKVPAYAPDKLCLKDGSFKSDKDGYGDTVMFVSASRRSDKPAPECRDRDGKTILTKTSGKPYSGCYVNAVLDVWIQDNKFGKRINCELVGVQFVKDGEAFGGASAKAADSDFDNLPDEDGETAF